MNRKMETGMPDAASLSGRTLNADWAKLPEPFNFYRPVFNSDRLYFGFWPEGSSDLSLEDAQDKMAALLMSHLPDPPARVLDAGCGLGYLAALLAQRGYQVTAIAPSESLIGYARRTYGSSGADFQNAGFLDETDRGFAAERYQVILFQESLQGLHPIEKVFSVARRLLHPKGIVLFGDEVCLDRSIQKHTAVHPLNDILNALAENGFRISSRTSASENGIQTCSEVIRRFSLHLDPVAGQEEDTAERIPFYLNGWKSRFQWYRRGQMGYEICTARKDDIFVRAYRDGDENAILPLFHEVFHNPRTLEHWKWKFADNPFGKYRIAAAFTETGELTAHFSGYPVPFYFKGIKDRPMTAYQGGDTMTNPKFRSSGLGRTSVLGRTAAYFYSKFCDGVVPFFYGFNTGNIRKFGERFLRFEYLRPVPYHVKDIGGKKPAASGRLTRLMKGLTVEKVSAAGLEYDRFFEKACGAYEIMVRRDAAYLKWRYLDCPDALHHVFAVRSWGRLVGWGVFSIRGNTLIWGDALCAPSDTHAMAFLLEQVAGKMPAQLKQIAGWFSQNPGWWHAFLKKMGFAVQKEPDDLSPCVILFDDRLSSDLFDTQFYYTMGDSDLF